MMITMIIMTNDYDFHNDFPKINEHTKSQLKKKKNDNYNQKSAKVYI